MNNLVVGNNFNQEKINLIKSTVAQNANDLELQLFIEQCKRTGLDPITRQIYFMKNDGKVQIQVSIDGFRLIAERSGDYAGQTPAQWCGDDGNWKDVWLSKIPPRACRVGVWKKNFKEPLYAIALYDEYAQKKKDGSPAFMWSKMPALMLSKVAESLALRRAFPNDLSGLYTPDEMGQSENEAHDAHKVSAQNDWKQPKKVEQRGTNPVFQRSEPEILGAGNYALESNSLPGGTSSSSGNSESFENFTGSLSDDGYRIPFGKKHNGKKLTEIDPADLKSYYDYINNNVIASGVPASKNVETFLQEVERFLNLK